MTTIQREIRTFKSLQIFKIVRSPAAFFCFLPQSATASYRGPDSMLVLKSSKFDCGCRSIGSSRSPPRPHVHIWNHSTVQTKCYAYGIFILLYVAIWNLHVGIREIGSVFRAYETKADRVERSITATGARARKKKKTIVVVVIVSQQSRTYTFFCVIPSILYVCICVKKEKKTKKKKQMLIARICIQRQ